MFSTSCKRRLLGFCRYNTGCCTFRAAPTRMTESVTHRNVRNSRQISFCFFFTSLIFFLSNFDSDTDVVVNGFTSTFWSSASFQANCSFSRQPRKRKHVSLSSTPADDSSPSDSSDESDTEDRGFTVSYTKGDGLQFSNPKVLEIKRAILATAAGYDRGYGATQTVRDKVDKLIDELAGYQQIDDVTTGFLDTTTGEYKVEGGTSSTAPPLKGCWQMIWTTAYDVLSIATPLSTVSAIYQEIDPSTLSAVNVIDLIPRTQYFLPPQLPLPVTRLKVYTKATRRGPRRVGLLFESLEVQPLKNWIQQDLPVPLKVDLPTKYLEDFFSSPESPGYFDVTYVDDDMLIIQQNAPGGCFISVKVDSSDLE